MASLKPPVSRIYCLVTDHSAPAAEDGTHTTTGIRNNCEVPVISITIQYISVCRAGILKRLTGQEQ